VKRRHGMMEETVNDWSLKLGALKGIHRSDTIDDPLTND